MCNWLEMRVLHTLFFMDLPNCESSRCSWQLSLKASAMAVLRSPFFLALTKRQSAKMGTVAAIALRLGVMRAVWRSLYSKA